MQNADENTYAADIIPTLEFKVVTKDLTFSGCAQTLFVMCNDVGFSEQDIERICSIGKSTKKARRHEGFVVQRGDSFFCLIFDIIAMLDLSSITILCLCF